MSLIFLLLCIIPCISSSLSFEPVRELRLNNTPWTSDLLIQLIHEDAPVVLREVHPGCDRFAKDEYLLSRNKDRMLYDVKRYPSITPRYHFPSDLPMAAVPSIMSKYASHFSRHNITLQSFLHLAQRGRSGGVSEACESEEACEQERFHGASVVDELVAEDRSGDYRVAYASHLSEWLDIVRDVDLKRYVPYPMDYKQPYLWMSEASATTPMHYDVYTNAYVQLRGEKTFYLSPPEAHDLLDLWPALHPAHRSSQLGDVIKHFTAASSSASAPTPTPTILSVTLRPGDVLLIPALWFHQVQAATFSVSVNVWTEYHGVGAQAEELNHLPLPLSDMWTKEEQIQVLRVYVHLALVNARVMVKGMEDGNSLSDNEAQERILARARMLLLAQRYKSIGMANETIPQMPSARDGNSTTDEEEDELAVGRIISSQALDQGGRYCGDGEALGRALAVGGYEVRLLQESIQGATRLLKSLQEQTTQGRLEVYVMNWIEHVACHAVGARQAHQFLVDLLGC